MNHLFGTDGIRGIAGRSPLTSRETYLLGRSAGHVLHRKNSGRRLRILGVRDTRESGSILFTELARGLREEGVDVYDAGILSTPSVAYLVAAHRFDSGFVISASHNPPEFNGIKFFTPHGRKWPDEWEREVESILFNFLKGKANFFRPSAPGLLIDASNFADDYEDFLIRSLGPKPGFSNFKIALDCSHGANSHVAPDLFKRLGASLVVLGASPTGKNINIDCGSQHTEKLSAAVKRQKCDVGIAFDGDGDRVIFVDEKGRETDGDYTIALLSRYFKKKKLLKNGKVVITVMAKL